MQFSEQGSKNDILYWSKRLYQKDMSPSTSGNISLKTPEGILITSSGVCLNDMNEDDIVLIDYDGNVINGTKKPSSEKIMHTEIYTKRDDINAIIHCHCPLITAFCVAQRPINKPILPDFALIYDEIPLIPYYCPSTIELAEAVGICFEKNNNVALLQNHGVVLGADTLQNAFYQIESLRAYVQTYFGAEVISSAKYLNKKQVAEIRQQYIKK